LPKVQSRENSDLMREALIASKNHKTTLFEIINFFKSYVIAKSTTLKQGVSVA